MRIARAGCVPMILLMKNAGCSSLWCVLNVTSYSYQLFSIKTVPCHRREKQVIRCQILFPIASVELGEAKPAMSAAACSWFQWLEGFKVR